MYIAWKFAKLVYKIHLYVHVSINQCSTFSYGATSASDDVMEKIYVQLEQNNYTLIYSQMEMLFIVIVRTPQRTPYNLDYRVHLQQWWMDEAIIHHYSLFLCMNLHETD